MLWLVSIDGEWEDSVDILIGNGKILRDDTQAKLRKSTFL
jgi:hypothetical protein